MYKIGDKVETPIGIGILSDISANNETKYKVMYGSRSTWYAHDEIKPYQSAHEKLIEMGWEVYTDNINVIVYKKTIQHDVYRDDYIKVGVYKKEKKYNGTVHYNDRFSSAYRHHSYDFELDLSRILTQYLEEME